MSAQHISDNPSVSHSAVPFFVLTFLLNFVPSQPYLTTFLQTGRHSFSDATLNSSVWPVSTYAMLFFSLPCGVLASSFPSLTLLSGVLARVILYVLLIGFNSVFSVQAVEVLYGLFVVVDGLVLVSSGCLGAPESSYAYIAAGITGFREVALVLSSLCGQFYFETLMGSDDSSLENLFWVSLFSSIIGLLWYACSIRIPVKVAHNSHEEKPNLIGKVSSLSALYSRRRSLYLLTFVFCLSYASYLTAADYNFMLLTSRTSSNLGIVATSLSVFGALGAFLAGWYYKKFGAGMTEIAVLGVFSVAAFAYLGFSGSGSSYYLVVISVVLPWAVYQTARTLLTILISTAVGEASCSLLPAVLGVGTLFGLLVASTVQFTVSSMGGRTESYFVACLILESLVMVTIVISTSLVKGGCLSLDYDVGSWGGRNDESDGSDEEGLLERRGGKVGDLTGVGVHRSAELGI
ncbi:hypothetical protein TrCOL_g7054 [Triparma columacea]|uniref:Uncharacterized protein n=1 Tax=Triparma columacea TaxID=722753 RepID=A0A9W7L4N3_9STRA|nr:hypothetical protein TrCOL_g7054 [Triparma columacea]